MAGVGRFHDRPGPPACGGGPGLRDPALGRSSLKQWRGIATRYDKTAQSYEAAVTLASLLTWA
ncbi:hypothetical protein GCM10028832_09530 [Streptomyces sparsus]